MQSAKSETNLITNNNHKFNSVTKELDEELKIVDDKLSFIKNETVKYSALKRIADERKASAKMILEEENDKIKQVMQ